MDDMHSDTMNYIREGIKHVCLRYKNRAPGSQNEKECQKYFKRELGNWADQVEEETFELHPKAFMGSITVCGLLNLLCVLLFVLSLKTNSILLASLATAVILFSAVLNVTQTLLYRRCFDFLFPKSKSTNIMARRTPKGEVKRRIIFGAHADAAYEMTYTLHGQIKVILPVLAGSALGAGFVCIANTALLIHRLMGGSAAFAGGWRTLALIELACIPFFLAVVFFTNWSRVVDGANDNLSACYVAMGVLKEMAQRKERFENTEVCCLITGAEEAGLRGALAYAQRHTQELSQVETIFIALDTLREVEQFKVFTRGLNGLQKDSAAVGALIHQAGKNCGTSIPKANLFFGATDAEGFSRSKLRSCGFCGVNLNPKRYYHTRFDTWDNISQDCLRLSLKVCLEASRIYDESGGIAKFEG